jgi:hypothetical protein
MVSFIAHLAACYENHGSASLSEIVFSFSFVGKSTSAADSQAQVTGSAP